MDTEGCQLSLRNGDVSVKYGLTPTVKKIKERMNIQRRMLLFALAVGLSAFLAMGGIFLYTMLDIRDSMRVDERTLRDEVVRSVGYFAETQAMRRLQEVSEAKARHLDHRLYELTEEANLESKEISDILQSEGADACFVLSNTGRLILFKRDDGVLMINPDEKELFTTSEPNLTEARRRMMAGEAGVMPVTLDGEAHYLAFAPMRTLGWSFGSILEKGEVMDAVARAEERIWDELQDFQDSQERIFAAAKRVVIIMILPLLCMLVYGSRKVSKHITNPIRKLTEEVREISRGDLDRKIDLETGDEIEDLASCFNSMTDELKTHIKSLAKAAADEERVQTELSVAGKIQRDMLPVDVSFLKDRGGTDLHAVMYAARNVGGDFYDFYPLGDDHLAVTIADVSGKGIPAALFMVMVRTVLRDLVSVMPPGEENIPAPGRLSMTSPPVQGVLSEVMGRANNLICRDNANSMFATVFLGILDLRSGCLDYVNAGHNPPLLCRKSFFSSYLPKADDTFIGVMEGISFKQRRLRLEPGDLLLLYTDGVTEAMNKAEEQFTEQRLKETVANIPKDSGAEDALRVLREEVRLHANGAEQSDDLTMLALRYSG